VLLTGDTDWDGYVAGFHADRAGITEDLLEHAHDSGARTPYDWAAEAVPPALAVLDLACGSAPMHARLRAAPYVGVDLSPAELRSAAAREVPVAIGDASWLPLADRSVDAVVMSMALMLVPLPATLAEVARVLRPGGLLVATVPAGGPLPLGDWLRYARLCLALRHRGLAYPNDRQLADAGSALAAAGLTVTSDEARGFGCDLATPVVADRLLDSLYLPGVDATRMAAGRRVSRRWVGTTIAIPIRRLVATR
jgi:SAM-dependent methyltransferase